MRVYRVGLMQGRLTPSLGRGIQFFPFEEWRNEFETAKSISIPHIDFIFDLERFEENPLWTKGGIEKIKESVRKTGVGIHYICADFFMRLPFFRGSKESREKSLGVLRKLLSAAPEIGAHTLELPFLDNSSIKTLEEEDCLVEGLRRCFDCLENRGAMKIALETDLPPFRFLSLLKKIAHPSVKAVYDSGNSASLGYDPRGEIENLAPFLSHIHMKDRKLKGNTVPLGTGDTNFDAMFKTLAEVGFQGDFILQAARGEDGAEQKTVTEQKEFTEQYIKKYLTGGDG